MERHGIVAGEPDHTGLGWLSRQLQRLFSRPAQPQTSNQEEDASSRPSTATAKQSAAAPSEPRQRGR
jgi:hypothetical protein